PMDVLFGKAPKMHRDGAHPAAPRWPVLQTASLDLQQAGLRVLAHPTVASKSFLVTIGDRSVGGLTAREQMIGPWQLPLADCAITLAGFDTFEGEAMSIGERTPLALLNAAASARMAVGEAITNLCAAPVQRLDSIKLSANWMAAAGHSGEDALLYDAVRAIGMELCPALELSIPVGKDSLSMQSQWQVGNGESGIGNGETPEPSAFTIPDSPFPIPGGTLKSVSPVSLIISAFAPVTDVRTQLTPLLRSGEDSELWLIGLGGGKQRLGGSVLAQVYADDTALPAFGGEVPDLDDAQRLRSFFELIRDAREAGLLLAYHDRSDGGAFAALCEMAFASRQGLDITLDAWGDDAFRSLFNEELGAVVQIASEDRAAFADLVERHALTECAQRIARPTGAPRIRV
ncbi:AIR synthase-related protein, partial [Xanthomonas perforans]|nr:AIR synthase-related protein [Xanthomonas perforans]